MMDLKYLKPNDIVDIIAPASRCDLDDLEKAKQFLTSWNLRNNAPSDLFGNDLFCANRDEIRFKHLVDALTNPHSTAVWCLRGGYGSMKLIPELAKIKPPSQAKLFIGSSDITALHIFLQDAWGWQTVHGPSLNSAGLKTVSDESLALLKDLIFRNNNAITLHKITPLNSLAEKDTSISASIIGGNLCLIQASLGTPWQINATNKILFIEEVNERGYRIDRMLEQLKQANIIEQTSVILFGDMIGGKESNGQSLAQDAIIHFANTCNKPVLQIKGVGHDFINHPILLGKTAKLQMGHSASLTFNL